MRINIGLDCSRDRDAGGDYPDIRLFAIISVARTLVEFTTIDRYYGTRVMASSIVAEPRRIPHRNHSIQRWDIQDLQLLYCSLTVTTDAGSLLFHAHVVVPLAEIEQGTEQLEVQHKSGKRTAILWSPNISKSPSPQFRDSQTQDIHIGCVLE